MTGDGQRESPWRVLRFLVSGGLAAAVNVASLYIFTEYLAVWYIYSSVFAFFIAFAVNFCLQKYWVFESPEYHKIPRQLPLHLGAALFNNLLLNTAILFCLVEYAHLWYIFAQILTSAVIAVESFVVFRWIFR